MRLCSGLAMIALAVSCAVLGGHCEDFNTQEESLEGMSNIDLFKQLLKNSGLSDQLRPGGPFQGVNKDLTFFPPTDDVLRAALQEVADAQDNDDIKSVDDLINNYPELTRAILKNFIVYGNESDSEDDAEEGHYVVALDGHVYTVYYDEDGHQVLDEDDPSTKNKLDHDFGQRLEIMDEDVEDDGEGDEDADDSDEADGDDTSDTTEGDTGDQGDEAADADGTSEESGGNADGAAGSEPVEDEKDQSESTSDEDNAQGGSRKMARRLLSWGAPRRVARRTSRRVSRRRSGPAMVLVGR